MNYEINMMLELGSEKIKEWIEKMNTEKDESGENTNN
jgi:hypothetical protein